MMEVQFMLTQGLAALDYKYKAEKQRCDYYSAQGVPRHSPDSLQQIRIN